MSINNSKHIKISTSPLKQINHTNNLLLKKETHTKSRPN